MSRNILLLIGSPKKEPSNSESLGTYLLEKLQQKGFQAETLFVHRAVKDADKFIEAVDRADIIILATRLYIDSLPYPVIDAMEQIAEHRKSRKSDKKQYFAAIVNCGFPEVHHNDIAIAICRCFAKEAGFDWAGGLALGAGETIGGKPLAKLGFVVRNIVKSLDMAAQDLADGKPISEQAMQFMAKPLMPNWMYRLVGDFMWRKQAKVHGYIKICRIVLISNLKNSHAFPEMNFRAIMFRPYGTLICPVGTALVIARQFIAVSGGKNILVFI